MNIVMIGSFQYSGRTRHILTLGEELEGLGHRVAVIMPRLPDNLKIAIENCFQKITITTPGSIDFKEVDLLHLHSADRISFATELSVKFGIPCVMTLHGNSGRPLPGNIISFLKEIPAAITPRPELFNALHKTLPGIEYIPESIKIHKCNPEINERPSVTYIADEDNYKREGYNAVSKAAGVAGLPLEVINNDKPLRKEGYHGWIADISSVLCESDIVIASGRSLLEGIAACNAALVMGTFYKGIFDPPESPRKPLSDYSGTKGKKPCYRDIFYDLCKISRDSNYSYRLQKNGYKYASANFNITKTAGETLRVYHQTLSRHPSLGPSSI